MTDYLPARRHASSSPGRQNPTCQLSLVHEPMANFSSVPLNVASWAGSNLNARFRFGPGNSSSAATTFIFAPGCASTSLPEPSNATNRGETARKRAKKADIAERIKRAKAAQAQRETKEAEPKTTEAEGDTKEAEPLEQAGSPTSQFGRWLELEEMIDGEMSDVHEILIGPADELDHAKALESGIEYFEQLDRLMRVQVARRNDVLEQIEFNREGLGRHLRQISDDIIDAEFSETKQEAPSIAGLATVHNDLGEKGGGQPD